MKDKVKQEVREFEFLASKEEYERFVRDSIIWKDMKLVVTEWLDGIKEALINPDITDDEKTLADFQGRAQMCKLFLNLPQDTIDAIRDEEDLPNKEELNNG